MSLLTWDQPRSRNTGNSALAAAGQRPATDGLTPLRMTLIGAMLIAVGPISMTLYTPALTLLAHVFATTEDAVRTTITVYLFGFALAQLLCGPLSDRYGRRPVVLGCLALYVVGAAVCTCAGIRWGCSISGGWCKGSGPAAAWRCRALWSWIASAARRRPASSH